MRLDIVELAVANGVIQDLEVECQEARLGLGILMEVLGLVTQATTVVSLAPIQMEEWPAGTDKTLDRDLCQATCDQEVVNEHRDHRIDRVAFQESHHLELQIRSQQTISLLT